MWNDRYGVGLFAPAVFDPLSATALGLTVAGGATSALGTLAGGSAAKRAGLAQQQADEFRVQQAEQNAQLARAAGGVRAQDTGIKTNQVDLDLDRAGRGVGRRSRGRLGRNHGRRHRQAWHVPPVDGPVQRRVPGDGPPQ